MSNNWYENHFPIEPHVVDCRNCLEHRPPMLSADGCIYCEPQDSHVLCNRAIGCNSFLSYIQPTSEEEAKVMVNEDTEPTYMSLGDFFAMEKEIEAAKEMLDKVEEKTEAEWKPNSQLDMKVFDFNDETLPAALRAMFDILKGMEKRLTAIEEKMPSKKVWEIKNFFKKKKSWLVTKKNKYKWKIKGKIRKAKEKTKKTKTGFEALFKPKA